MTQRGVEEVKQILGELAGYASLCWEPKPTGVFDSIQAGTAVQVAYEKLFHHSEALEAEVSRLSKALENFGYRNDEIKKAMLKGLVHPDEILHKKISTIEAELEKYKTPGPRNLKFQDSVGGGVWCCVYHENMRLEARLKVAREKLIIVQNELQCSHDAECVPVWTDYDKHAPNSLCFLIQEIQETLFTISTKEGEKK